MTFAAPASDSQECVRDRLKPFLSVSSVTNCQKLKREKACIASLFSNYKDKTCQILEPHSCMLCDIVVLFE